MKNPVNLLLILPLLLIAACSEPDPEPENPGLKIEILKDHSVEGAIFDPKPIRENEVIALTVENCLTESNCYSEHYTFNDCGKVVTFHPPMVASWYRYEYDSDCRRIATYHKGSDTTKYSYKYLPGDSVEERIYSAWQGQESMLSYIFRYKLDESVEEAERDALGRVKSRKLGSLHYPCGIDLPGNHISEYSYHPNGLLKMVVFTNESGEVEVVEKYTYTRKDSTEIRPEDDCG